MKNKTVLVFSLLLRGSSTDGRGETLSWKGKARGRLGPERPGEGNKRGLGWWLPAAHALTLGRPRQHGAQHCCAPDPREGPVLPPAPARPQIWQPPGLGSPERVFQVFRSSPAAHRHRSPPPSMGPQDQLGSVGSELALRPHQFNPLLVFLKLLAQLG